MMKKTTEKQLTTNSKLFTITSKGELIELGNANITSKEERVNSNFEMIFDTSYIIKQKGEIGLLFYLMKISKNNVVILSTQDTIAKRLGVERKSISRWMKNLEEANQLVAYRGTIIINPMIRWKGKVKGKEEASQIYWDAKEKKKKGKE